MTNPQADRPRRLPRRRQPPHALAPAGVRQPDRLLVVRAHGAHRRARQVRLLLPRRGPRAARARRRRSSTRTSSAGPDTFTVLASLAAVTEHLGLAGTINATFNEPYELARQLATPRPPLGRRAAWNIVTSLRRVHRPELPPRRLPRPVAAVRAGGGALALVRELWDSWADDEIVVGQGAGVFARSGDAARSQHTGPQFDYRGRFSGAALAAGPPGDPAGRRLAAGPRLRGGELRRDLLAVTDLRRGPGVLPGHQGARGRVRAQPRRPQDPAERVVRARGHRGGGGGEGALGARGAGHRPRPRRSCSSRSGTATCPLRPRRPAADVEPALDAPPFIAGRALTDADRPQVGPTGCARRPRRTAGRCARS